MKTALPLLFCATLFLAACVGPDSRAPEIVRVEIPEALLRCGAEPVPPEVRTQRDAALYIVDLRSYARECASRLDAIRDFQSRLSGQHQPPAKAAY